MRTIAGANDLSVRELGRGDLHLFSEKAWKADRLLLLNSLDESRAEPELRLKSLREHDANRGTFGPIFLMTFQIAGCDEIIDAACAKSQVDPVRFKDGLPDGDRQRIARELLGIRPLGESKATGESG